MPHATMKRLSASSLRKQRSMDVKGSSADGSGHHSNKTMSSTMTPKRRTSIQDLHSSRPTKRSLPRPPPGARNISAIGNLVHAASVKRWNGNRRTTSLWDSLRRVSTRMKPAKLLLTKLEHHRTRSYGFLKAIASYISMNTVNLDGERHCEFPLQISKQAIAIPFSGFTLPVRSSSLRQPIRVLQTTPIFSAFLPRTRNTRSTSLLHPISAGKTHFGII